MSHSMSSRIAAGSQRGTFLLSTLAVTLGILFAASAGPVPKVQADKAAAFFCEPSGLGWLDPAWTGIYRCDSPDKISGYNRTEARVFTYERAGCVDYADVWHNLIDSWRCVPNWSEGAIAIRQDGGWYRGVIRNNNLSKGGWFRGVLWWNQ